MIASGVTVGWGRYYLKERSYHGTLVQDEEADRIVKESRLWEAIYNLKAMQVADEITHQVCVRRERERDNLLFFVRILLCSVALAHQNSLPICGKIQMLCLGRTLHNLKM